MIGRNLTRGAIERAGLTGSIGLPGLQDGGVTGRRQRGRYRDHPKQD